MKKITNEQGAHFLSEQHIDPDFGCDYDPAEYGFEIIDEEREQ